MSNDAPRASTTPTVRRADGTLRAQQQRAAADHPAAQRAQSAGQQHTNPTRPAAQRAAQGVQQHTQSARPAAQGAARAPQRSSAYPQQTAQAGAGRVPQQRASAQQASPAAQRAPQQGAQAQRSGQHAPQQQRPAQSGQRRSGSSGGGFRTSGGGGASKRALAFVLIIVCIGALIFYLTRSGGTAGTAPASHGVELSEIMTSNKGTVPDETGDFPDWIEVHNTTNQTLSIAGFGLSDDPLVAAKWTFPAGTTLEPDAYMIVYCSGDSDKGAMHAPFKLSASDTLTLSTESGTAIESVQLRGVTAGMSLVKDGVGAWVEMTPSPGYPNTEEGAARFLETLTATSGESIGVYLNEFMASNASTIIGPDGTYCDWIELYNSNAQEVDLSGYGVSDSSAQPLKYVLPQGTVIPGNGVLLIYCDGREGTDPAKPEAPFGLAAYKEEVVFSTPAGKILDSTAYSRMETDHSMARSPDGTGAWGDTAQPTPGYLNNSKGLEAFTASQPFGTGDLILSEVMNANYSTLRQADLSYPDWIELYNQSGSAVNLSGYALSKNAKNPAKWVFPDVTIQPGEYMIVLATGNNVSDVQKKNLETNFGLSGAGDALFLFSPEGVILDKLLIGRGHANVSYGRTGTQLMYYASPTPGAANAGGSPGYAAEPAFSLAAGVYTSAQTLTIEVPEGCSVHYTTDCSVPTESSAKYASPISVGSNTVIRARTFRAGYEPSDVATASYFINVGAETLESHNTAFSILSIVTDPDDMFGTVNGIYVAGAKFAEKTGESATSFTLKDDTGNTQWKYANFNAQHQTNPDPKGLNWERQAHLDLIDATGAFEYEGDAMIRIFGAFSRFKSQKGFSIVTRPGYGDVSLDNKFFDTRPYVSYQSLTLRASAMDCFMSKIRDVLIQGLLEDGGSILPTQAYRRVIVYINNQYWGIYNMREKVNKHFLAQRYGIDPETVEILVGNGTTEAAQISGTNAYIEYKALLDWVGSHDLSNADNYAAIQQQVDVENFAEYCAMEIFVGNTDSGNIKFWRSAAYDNKWRWIPYDFDWAFNREDGQSDITTTSGYRRDFFAKYFHETGHGVGKGFSTVLSRGLLKNSNFRALFLQKCALMYNEIFTSEKLTARIEELAAEMKQEINFDTQRWDGFSLKTWERSIENLKNTAANAPEYFIKYCQSYFSLSDSETTELFGKVSSK